MRSFLAGGHTDDVNFWKLWADKLRLPTQQVLSVLWGSTTSDKVAQHADWVHKCHAVSDSCNQVFQVGVDRVSSASPHHGTAIPSSSPCNRCKSINSLAFARLRILCVYYAVNWIACTIYPLLGALFGQPQPIPFGLGFTSDFLVIGEGIIAVLAQGLATALFHVPFPNHHRQASQ